MLPAPRDAPTEFPAYSRTHPVEVELQQGDMLYLPAYWYHQEETFAPTGRLNVALSWQFRSHTLLKGLHETLRENVFINCTEPAKPGEQHPCGF